jgi:hypothetical protein
MVHIITTSLHKVEKGVIPYISVHSLAVIEVSFTRAIWH